MKAAFVAFLLALSVSAWSYAKLQHQTGHGNASAALKGAALIFVLTFLVAFTLSRSFLH